MRREVAEKLDGIFRYPFFKSVGQTLPSTVIPVSNWAEAFKQCNSERWETCRLMARNTLQVLVEERDWERTQDWDPLVDELRPRIVSFVDGMLHGSGVPRELQAKIQHTVSWDIMFICVEYEYQDVVTPLFHALLLDSCYSAGHFPCGWSGKEFPDSWDGVIGPGKLMVY